MGGTCLVRPGRYPVLLVMDSETEFHFIASRTNWQLGASRWFDGNDLADLTPAHVDTLATRGLLAWPKRYLAGRSPDTLFTKPLIGCVLFVVVE